MRRAWLNAAAYEHCTTMHHDHDHDHHDHATTIIMHDRDIASFCFVRDKPIPREALRLLLDALQQNLGPNLLRVKGIVNVAEEPDRPAVIQGAQHLLHNLSWLDRWPDADRRSKIVFITQGYRPRRGRGHDRAARPGRGAHGGRASAGARRRQYPYAAFGWPARDPDK